MDRSHKKKFNYHDILFKDIFEDKKYCLDILRLVFTPTEFGLFSWKTLKSEATFFLDEEWKERRADLVFSAKLRNGKSAKIVLLLEHKSYQDTSLLKQLLEYQARIYTRKKKTECIDVAVIPIVVYHGREKRWKGPLRFQDSIQGLSPDLRRHFGENILDFKCRLFNLQNMDSWRKKNLTTAPILFTMASIWRVKEESVAEVFQLAKKLNWKEREELLKKAATYINHCNKKFTLKRLQKIEARVIKNGEDRIMPAVKSILDVAREEMREEAREEARKEAREEALEEGIEKGREEGEWKKAQEIAKTLLASGMDFKFVAKTTGLSLKEVKKLAKK